MANSINEVPQTEQVMEKQNLHPGGVQNVQTNKFNEFTIYDDKNINASQFPEFMDSLGMFVMEHDVLSQQIQTFNTQSQMLGMDQNNPQAQQQADQMNKIISQLTDARNVKIQQLDQLALTFKAQQLFNTTKLEDIVLVNDNELNKLSQKEIFEAGGELHRAAFGGKPPKEEEQEQPETQDVQDNTEEVE